MHVLITGSNRGIGKALADGYAARGHDVTRTARSGGDIRLDVSDPASCAAMAATLNGAPLDLLVCNAGIFLDKDETLTGYPADMWAQTFAANVTGVFLTIQALLPNLRATTGKIAIISSQLGSQERALGGSYIYRASKAAALNLGRNMAVDLAPNGIAVGIYHPGWVRTEMGGDDAAISTKDSASGLIARFDALGPETTGCFENWDGRAHPM